MSVSGKKALLVSALCALVCANAVARSTYSQISMSALDLAEYDDGAYMWVTATPGEFCIYYLWNASNEETCGGYQLDFSDFQYENISMGDDFRRVTLCGNASLYMASDFYASDEMDYKKETFVWFSLIDIDDDLYISLSFEGNSYGLILDEYWYSGDVEYIKFTYTRRSGSERDQDYDFDSFLDLIELCMSE